MENILKHLGSTIKKARLASKLTQDELAERIGVTSRYIMALENELKKPSFDVLCKLIRILVIPADSIFFPEEEHTEDTKEQLTRMIEMCNERDLKIITATVKAILETN